MVRQATQERIRERVRRRQYIMTLHAEEEMMADGLTVIDVEAAMLCGEVHHVQRDRQTRDRKYVIECLMSDGAISVVCRFGPRAKLVIITVFRGRLEWE